MSDTQIFVIGVFASLLIAVHVGVHLIQFRRIDREMSKEAPPGHSHEPPGHSHEDAAGDARSRMGVVRGTSE